MKKYVSFILILILLIGSFYYADKVSNFIINKSPLMKTLKSNKDKYEIKSVDAIVSDEYIIPGIEGKKVSEIESYYNMKKYNTFVSNKLIYKSIIPSISLEKNKDLIINKANPFKKGVSLLVSNNKGVITYSKNLDITLLVNDKNFKGNILNEQINDGQNFNKTNDILLVQTLLNHGSVSTTQRYLGTSQEKIDEISSSIDFSNIYSNSINDL